MPQTSILFLLSNDFPLKIFLLIFSTFVFSILWFFNCSWVTLELYKSQLVELRIYTKNDIIFFLQFYAALKLSDNFFNLIKLNVHFRLLWMIYIFRKFLVYIINISCSDFSLILFWSNSPKFQYSFYRLITSFGRFCYLFSLHSFSLFLWFFNCSWITLQLYKWNCVYVS